MNTIALYMSKTFKCLNKSINNFKDLSNMKLNFRQGIVRSRSYLGNPDFLAINQATGFISINIIYIPKFHMHTSPFLYKPYINIFTL